MGAFSSHLQHQSSLSCLSCPSPHIESFLPAARQFPIWQLRTGIPQRGTYLLDSTPVKEIQRRRLRHTVIFSPRSGQHPPRQPANSLPLRFLLSASSLNTNTTAGPTDKMFSLDINWWGLVIPLSYVLVLGGSLMSFSTIYRKRKAGSWHLT
jgi:hypothetical protein